jgi:AcrR family transcriptional regulator
VSAARGTPAPIRAPGTVEGPDEATQRRILVATAACLGRFGFAKTTLDDVAREAGCSRATLYRYFPGKTALVRAAADAEIDAVVTATIAAAAHAETLEDAITEMMVTAARELIGNDALAFVLEHEPELVLGHLSFDGGDRLLGESGRRFTPALARFLSWDRAERAAEWCTRVLLAHLHPVGAPISMTDDVAVRGLVRQFVLAGCTAGASPTPHRGARP